MKQEIKKGDLVRLKPPPKEQQSRYDRWRYLVEQPYLVVSDNTMTSALVLGPDGRQYWWDTDKLEKIDACNKK